MSSEQRTSTKALLEKENEFAEFDPGNIFQIRHRTRFGVALDNDPFVILRFAKHAVDEDIQFISL